MGRPTKKQAAKPAKGAARKPSKLERTGRVNKYAAVRFEQRAVKYKTALEIVAPLEDFDGDWTEDLGAALFDLLAEGLSIDEIDALQPKTPPRRVLLRWLADKTHPFQKVYNDGKGVMIPLYEERAFKSTVTPLMMEQTTVRDGEDDRNCYTETKTVDNVERSKLMFAGYGWVLSHMAPHKHGKNADGADGEQKNDKLEELFNALMDGPNGD